MIALKNTDGGVLVDAVMLSEDDISIVFSFTRSYFHVDLERVAEAVVFLKSIMPRKPVSELFTVLGRAKQGKTERYRELMHHLEHTSDQFAHAPGERGLVMVCFTLPSFDVVFKVIRDRFAYPKTVLRDEVLAKYRLVFIHDRAGRLVDAQEFRRLRFPRARFAPELLEELRRETGEDRARGRRRPGVRPHVHRAAHDAAEPLPAQRRRRRPPSSAVLDYGQCIRDLAYTNIFPGDLLLKNFGVTRHGRVIFYDYDELCQVTDCTFRDLPQASNPEDEMRGEAWFYVAENDVFPETFVSFLSFDDRQRAALLRMHGEILTAALLARRAAAPAGRGDGGGAALPPPPRTGGEQPLSSRRRPASTLRGFECAREIGEQVVNILEPDRQAHRAFGDAPRCAAARPSARGRPSSARSPPGTRWSRGWRPARTTAARSAKRRAAPAPPLRSKVTMVPKSCICCAASACCGCDARPG